MGNRSDTSWIAAYDEAVLSGEQLSPASFAAQHGLASELLSSLEALATLRSSLALAIPDAGANTPTLQRLHKATNY